MRHVPDPPPFAEKLFTVGVTGTNGKTTTTTFIASLLAAIARPVAKITTLGFFLDDTPLDVPPHYEGFVQTLRRGFEGGGKYAAIEFTSEALSLGAARGWPCDVAVFTNLSRDHLDAHGSMEHYLASKAQLFVTLKHGGSAVLNACDEAAALIDEVVPAGRRKLLYGLPSRGAVWGAPDLVATDVRFDWSGTRVTLAPSSVISHACTLHVRAIGEIFAENALAALAAALAANLPLERALDVLASVATPDGRFERVAGSPNVVVDYAHSPDALARTLATARALCTGKLTVVFGAGGNRDVEKRPLLGRAATAADRIVLTSDNPRDESPQEIARAIREGVSAHDHVDVELDRGRAIELALADAADDDLIVIAGKGHERDQLIQGERRAFSDREVAIATLRKLGRTELSLPPTSSERPI